MILCGVFCMAPPIELRVSLFVPATNPATRLFEISGETNSGTAPMMGSH